METLCIIIIFVISGLVLKTEELLAAIKHPFPLLYGLVAILGMTPMIGFATIHIPFQPPEFAVGEPLSHQRRHALLVSLSNCLRVYKQSKF